MKAEDFLGRVAACREWVLARASEHEQGANYAVYVHDSCGEKYDREEYHKLLSWVEALDMILTERPYLGQDKAGN